MGNCLKKQSSSNSDEWDFEAAEGTFAAATSNKSVTTTTKTITEVKIKITKKQLEELLGKMDVKKLRVEQVLSNLIDHSGGYQSLQRPWRPALQSIPE